MNDGAIVVHLTESVTHFSRHAEWTGALARDEGPWLAQRRALLTASDVAGVLNLDDSAPTTRRTAVSIYADKVLGHVAEIVGPDDPRFWGKVLEQPILTAAAKWHGWQYREGGALLRSRKHPWLACTLDAEIDQNRGYGWEPLEGKTSQITKQWDEEAGALPTWIIIQCQAQLLVTGCEVLTVYALLQGCRPVKIQIAADADFHKIIVEEGERFMDRLARLDPPEPDWRESSTRALTRLYPGLSGDVVDLPRDAYEKTIALDGLGKQIETLQREQKLIKNWLRHKIGPAMYGRLEKPVKGRAIWRWAPDRRGVKSLIQMAKAPGHARPYGQNGEAVANDDAIAVQLQASVTAREPLLPAPVFTSGDDDESHVDPFGPFPVALAKCPPSEPPHTPGESSPPHKIRIRKGKRK